jgi:hypothetical protein
MSVKNDSKNSFYNKLTKVSQKTKYLKNDKQKNSWVRHKTHSKIGFTDVLHLVLLLRK